MRVALIAVVLCAAAASAAFAATPYVREIECPVGGERFNFTDTMSSSSFGQRPDGKPYSNWNYPLPECPTNGLVVYRDFSDRELQQLATLLRTPEFAAVRALGRTYYTASFIERSLQPQSQQAIWLLLQASWHADDDPTLKARFRQEFVSAAQSAPLDPGSEDSIVLRLRVANALRELGRFDEATAAFGTISSAALGVSAPEGLQQYLDVLLGVNARRDASAEPLDAIPQLAAASICLEREGQPQWDEQGFCRAPELAAEVERIRENRRRAGMRQ